MFDADRPVTPEDVERVADELAWEAEERWWRENYRTRPYVRADREFDWYSPAYRYGFESAVQHHGRSWDDAEPKLRVDWDSWPHRPPEADWNDVREPVRDAWDHRRGREHDTHIDRTKM
jgi:hypothetical protein